MSDDFFLLWLPAFAITILCEVPVYALFLRDRIGLGAALAIGVALQCVTHPLFWLTWDSSPAYFYEHYDDAVFAFEAVIYLLEAGLVWWVLTPRQPWQRVPNSALALLASAAANSVSLVVGILSER